MKLYHGTSFIRGEKILKDGKIKGNNVERIYTPENISLPTTNGYVYFGDFSLSTYYANKTSVIYDKDLYVMIFEVDVDDSLIEVDYDEIEFTIKPFGKTDGFKDINNPTVQECWDVCKALRVRGDVPLVEGKFKYAKLRSNFAGFTDEDYTSRDEAKFTMDIVMLRNDFSEYAESQKQELYNKVNWKTEF